MAHPSYKDCSKVYQAARVGDVTGLRSALESEGYDPQKMEVNGSTPLHAASFYGCSDCVAILVHHGGDPNLKNSRFGFTSIEEAGNADIKALLEGLSQGWLSPNKKKEIPTEPLKAAIESTGSKEYKAAAVDVATYFEKKYPGYSGVAKLLRDGADTPNKVITAYTEESPFYKDLNEALRENKQDPPEFREFVEKATNVLAAAMGDHAKDEANKHKGNVYRGQYMPDAEQKQLKPGHKYALTQFTSTSTAKDVAIAFAKNTLICISGIKDEKFYGSDIPVCLKKISAFKSENEVLFPPGTEFVVDAAEMASHHSKTLFTVAQHRAAVLPHLKDIYAKHGLLADVGLKK